MGAGETAETDIEPARPWLDGEFSVCLCPQTWFLALNLVGVFFSKLRRSVLREI
jgi:hypothetical protein